MGVSDLLDRVKTFGQGDDVDDDLVGLDFLDLGDEAAEMSDESDSSSFDLVPDALDPDPAPPKQRGGDAKTQKPAPARGRVTAAQRREVKDAIAMMLLMGGGAISFRDQVCGGAVLDHADNIADKLVPIIVRNPKMLQWFVGGSGYMDYFALAMALLPVGKTVIGHHVTKSIGHDTDGSAEPVDYSRFQAPSF
jgi:hypothetical protein